MPLIILLFALFASIFTLQKQILQYAEPFFSVGSRMFFAGFILLGFCLFKNFNILKIKKKKHFFYIVLLSFLGFYVTNICEIYGTIGMDSSKVCLIYSLSPFFTVVLSFFLLKETLNLKQFIGLLLGFIGLLTINNIKTTQFELKENFLFTFSSYEISLLIAVITSVLGWILIKKLTKLGYSVVMLNGYSMLIGGSLALLHSFFSKELWLPVPVYNMSKFVEFNLITCLISNICCYNLFGFLLRKYSVTLLTFSGLLTPFFAILFGSFFLNEIITKQFFLALLFFFLGLCLFYYEELKKKAKKS